MTKERVLTVSVAARRCHVSEETIRSWIRRRLLFAHRTPTGRYQIPESALNDAVTNTQEPQEPQADEAKAS